MEKSPNCALAILYYYSTKAYRMAGLGQINCKINSTTKKEAHQKMRSYNTYEKKNKKIIRIARPTRTRRYLYLTTYALR